MKFGKLPSIDNVDFTLPSDPSANKQVFGKNNKKQKTLYIGATGWSMKEWVGKVYPARTKSPDFLHHYARQFNTIELNTTHYRIPDEGTIGKWYDQSTGDFRFCPKILQRISHSRELSPPGPLNLVRQFSDSVAGLKEKLGPCFLQLPPYFGADRLPVLEQFLEKWSAGGIPLAVEARHESWFDHDRHFASWTALLKKYHTATVITDVAGRRDVCHMGVTADAVLVRFVGNDQHPSDFSRLDAWAERLQKWFAQGLAEVYFFTHQPDNLLAPETAVYLAKKMAGLAGVKTRGPELIEENPEQQMTLF